MPACAQAKGTAMITASTATRGWNARIIYATLFMLPVAGISVRHWLSGSFLVLALWSLGYLWREREPLTREERVFLAICAFYFAVFVVTALVNGWTDLQTRFLGREIRFLFIIPIYLMVRRYPDAGVWLLRGCVIGAPVILAHSLYDVFILGKPFAEGAYSQLLLGPFAALLVFWLLTAWRLEHERFFRRLIPFSAVAAFVSVALSGARGAYLGLLGLAAIWLAMNLRGRRLALGALAAIAITLATVAILPTVAQRAGIAIAEFSAYMRTADPATLEGRFNTGPGRLGSVSARLEMWRVAILMFRDHPVWGVGRGNYEKAVGKYVERGLVHPEVAQHSHAHNAFLGTMASKGTVGLVAILALLLYPLAVFVRTFRRSPQTAMLGIIHISGFAIFSLFESAPFNKGNFITIFLIFLATFFVWHVQRVRQGGS
jgi:O-antigen ligase